MQTYMAALKRILVGAPVETQESRPRALSPLRALPIFGASIVSAVVYAPDAVVEALREGGQTQAIPWMASGVVVIMLLLGAAYRNNVREFVDTRGDYGLVSRHLGARGGVLALSLIHI